MKPQSHVTSSALIAGILYLFFQSWSMALSCFISGILIDIDHIYDYAKETCTAFKFNDLYDIALNDNIIRRTIVLHSWELVLLMCILAWFTNGNPWITGVLIGFGHHIIMDALYKEITILKYSFFWRWKNDFTAKKFPFIT